MGSGGFGGSRQRRVVQAMTEGGWLIPCLAVLLVVVAARSGAGPSATPSATVLLPGQATVTPCGKALVALRETGLMLPAQSIALRVLGDLCTAAEWASPNEKMAD